MWKGNTFKKHTNTKHPEEVFDEKSKAQYMTYEEDFFQIKIVDWQTVYACHICDEEFDHIKELKEHIEISQKDIFVQSQKEWRI